MGHVSLVTLGVDDLARATRFYEALGWRPSAASVPGTVTFFHGTPVLALFGREDLAADAHLEVPPRPAGAGGPGGSSALAMNVAAEEEVDRTIAAAEAAGGRVAKRPLRTEWGGYSGYFLDLDGHLWEVAHNPGFAVDAEGRVTLPDAGEPSA